MTLKKSERRRVCVVLVDRANYGRLKPVMQKLRTAPALDMQVLAAGTMVLERFDQPVRVVAADGFNVDGELYIELEGSTPTTMAKSIGFAIIEFASEYQRLQPEMVVIIGDRYEALAAAIAAAFMNITVFHIQGGEVSGSIDESTRHAITKFAHYHFPSTKQSAEFLERMGERPDTIVGIGCPSSDIALAVRPVLPLAAVNARGRGRPIDAGEPLIVAVYHPTTTDFGSEVDQMRALLDALATVGMQTLMLWPNIDAGSDHISKVIRVYRDKPGVNWLRNITNLTPEDYLGVLANAACVVGNSSSFVRDVSYFGTPVVLVGNRQNGRETAENVMRVPAEKASILQAIQAQLAHGPYPASTLYGDGGVAQRIVDAISSVDLYLQKQLAYPEVQKFVSHTPGFPLGR